MSLEDYTSYCCCLEFKRVENAINILSKLAIICEVKSGDTEVPSRAGDNGVSSIIIRIGCRQFPLQGMNQLTVLILDVVVFNANI